MPSEKLQIQLELVASQYKREAREAATATGQIGDAAATTGTGVNRMASGMGRAGNLIKAGFAAVAGAAILDVIGDLDQLGQKMEANERMAETVFGEMTDAARRWADENNEAFGIGENAMIGLIAKTQDLLVPMGFVRDEAFDMSKEILNAANALSEWEGGTITAEDAQLRLAKAMLGEREGLVELGVKITDQEVKARLAAKGMANLTGAARQQAIAQVTLELVTEKSTDALAAYEKRAGTATAAQKDLAAATADTAESWADILRPALDQAKSSMSDVADIGAFLSEKAAEQGDQATIAGQKTEGMVDVWEAATPIGALFLLALEKIADATGASGMAVGEAIPPVEGLLGRYRDITLAGPRAAGGIEQVGNKARAARGKIQELVETYTGLTNAMLASTDPIFAAVSAMQRLDEVQKDPEASALELAEAVIKAQDTLSTLAGDGTIEQGISIIAKAIGVTADEAQNLLEAAGLLDGTEINMLIRWDAEGNPLPFDLVEQWRKQLLAAGVAATTSGFGVTSGTGIAVRRHGGPVWAGRPYIVGERGPEMMIPQQSGTVISNLQLAGLSRPNVTGPTINVYSPTNNLAQDLQLATILASVTNMVESQ